MEQKKTYNRVVAMGLMLCFVAVLSLSALFITTHAVHDCTGDGCEICREIEGCIETIHRMTEVIGAGGSVLFAAFLLLFCLNLIWNGEGIHSETLVGLKIRLNN